MKLPFVSRKRLDEKHDQLEQALAQSKGLAMLLKVARTSNEEYEKRWGSKDGKVVLNNLQDALQLIQKYQWALSTLAAADPYYKQADKLLERWGMKPDGRKVVQGYQAERQPPRIIEVDHEGKAIGVREMNATKELDA